MAEIRCAIEIRESSERRGPGRLTGTLMTYGERAADRPEVFESGSLRWPDEGVVLRRQHARAAPIMRIVPEVRESTVVIDAELPDTQAGRDTAVEVRNGTLKGFSVEFNALKERTVDGVRRIGLADLVGAGLVDEGAYSSAAAEVRNQKRRFLWR